MEVVVAIIVLIFLLAIGVPIAASAGLAGLMGFVASSTPLKAILSVFATVPFGTSYNFSLTVIPLFIIMGYFTFHAGISEKAFDTARKWVGRLPGGLAIAVVLASAAFAACSGSSVATAATMGRISIPELRRYKYNDELTLGAVAAGGTLGVLIPPSLLLIIYGAATQVPVGKLLLAGFIPGILTTLMFSGMIVFRSTVNPLLGPRAPGTSWREKISSLKSIWGIIVLALLVMGGLYAGIFTPTEAGGIGAFGAFILAIFTRGREGKSLRDFGWLKSTLLDTALSFGSLFFLVVGIFVFAHFLSYSGAPVRIAEFVSNLSVPNVMILLAMCIFYIILGCFLDAIGMILLTIPVVFPIIMSMGYNPVWFGIILVKLCEICYVTPPVGLNLFVISSLQPDIPVERIAKGALPFVITDFITLAILIAFPSISLFLAEGMAIK